VILDPELALVHSSELDRSEVYVPESVVDFLETDVLAGESVGYADPIRLPPDAAVLADEPDFEVAGLFDSRKLPRVLPRRRAVGRRRRLLPEPFVGSFFVVLAPELVESLLLGVEVAPGRSGGLRLEGPVHTLVAAILLGMRGLDEFGVDPEANPPHGELGQTSEGRGRERDAVVGPDDARQAVFLEKACEHGLCEVHGGGPEALAGQQEAAVTIHDRQRVAVRAVPRPELPLEVGRPDRVRLVHGGHRPTGMARVGAAPAAGDQAVPFQEVAAGTPRRPLPVGALPRENA
jgi:hypothetical protein